MMTTQKLQGGAIRDEVQSFFSDHALFARGLKWVLYSHSFQISFGVAYDNRNREGHRFQQAQVQVEESVRASGSGCRQRISDDRLHHRRRPSAQRRDTEVSRRLGGRPGLSA
jgi:hypothetical protein